KDQDTPMITTAARQINNDIKGREKMKAEKSNDERKNIEHGHVKLGEEQRRIFDLLETSNENTFVTGKAGTGKSVLLQYFVKNTRKQVAVVAPTGVAALNVGGQTIHSFFGLKLEVQDTEDLESVRDMGYKKREILRKIDALVIDEVSMVSSAMMDMIDAKLRYARDDKERPFGGCQIIAFGDLYQLPPVVTSGQESRFIEDRYKTVYFFGAPVIKKNPFKIIEMEHVYRQKDDFFIDFLNKIRLGECSNSMLEDINDSCNIIPNDDQFITLTGDNATASDINRKKLAELPGKEYTYVGDVNGDITQAGMPTDLNLKLKVGCQVMMIKNDITDNTSNDKREKARWVNGTLGVISELGEDMIKVKINGVSHSIDKVTWDKIKYRYNSETKKLEKVKEASFTQYPIKLAYAVTIHKSQGQTFDSVRVDLRKGAFAAGQTYVALSRCRNMDTLYLTKPLRKEDVKVSQEVIDFMKNRVIQPKSKTNLYEVRNVRQRSDNWFKMRFGKVTGSTAYYLKNHSVSFAIEKGVEEDEKNYENDAMIRGRELESIGVAKFADKKNLKVEAVGFVDSLVHEVAGFSPDGVIYGTDGEIRTIIEHKAFGEKHHLACYEHIDEHVMYQIQFGLFVTGAKDAYLVLYNPDIARVKDKLLVRHVEKDNVIQELFRDRFEEYESGEMELTADSVRIKGSKKIGRAVLQCDDDGRIIAEFCSAGQAAERLGISYYSVHDVLRGKQKHAGGYVWKYKD
ncbi:AAA family ATPase, partial [Candidatus Saccharibacteria bacterium]|nr:AAA family ATPase [Candidatus Saccharibacteria bacterium]